MKQQLRELTREQLLEVKKEVDWLLNNHPTITIDCTTFDEFWEAYDYKKNRGGAEKKWDKLKTSEKELIMEYLPNYKLCTPVKAYRKNPTTFINQRTWEDELTIPAEIQKQININNQHGEQIKLNSKGW